MANVIAAAILIGVAIVAILLFFVAKPSAVIEMRGGKASARKGKVSPKFLQDCEEICARYQISEARISVYAAAGRQSLRFSSQIPSECHQKFRNLWNLDH